MRSYLDYSAKFKALIRSKCSGPIFYNVVGYLGFILVFLLCHITVLSIIAFFHFLLDHRMRTVEDWLFRNGWEVLMVTKIMAAYFVLRIVNLSEGYGSSLKSFFQSDFKWPHKFIFVAIIFLTTFILYLGAPKLTENGYKFIDFKIVSFIGITFFYLIDLFIFSYLKYCFPIKKRNNEILYSLFFSVVFYIVSTTVITYEKDLNFWILCHGLMISYLTLLNGRGWMLSSIYIVGFVAPIAVIGGLNPISGDLYSVMSFSQHISPIFIVVLYIMTFTYLFYSYKKPVEKR